MLTYSSLRVAYIDEREDTINGNSQKVYYSVLVKGGDKLDEEIYRIKLPGPPTYIGEGKPENQNHAIIFTRGEALQTIDMNQDNYFEEAFKMRNVLEEFHKDHHGDRRPTILGLREHIFTGSVSSLAWFMSNQETSFVTIDEWSNFEERMRNPKLNATEKDRTEATRQWVSYRGQTLSRTVRGMMYYKEALELQCFLDSAKDNG
nr:callose synthase 7-like [Tanacetum cinerariifolium]